MVESTTLDMVDLMSTSRGSDDSWAAAAAAATPAGDPWSAIEHRHHDAATVTTMDVVDQKAQAEADWITTIRTAVWTSS